MAHIRLREEVIKLRLSGYTYGQIKRTLGVSKSTLSDWLCKLPLSNEQLALLASNKLLSRDIAIEKCRLIRQKQRLDRLRNILEQQIKALIPLTERELFLAGIFHYLGEGTKQHGTISVSNSNPQVIQFTLYWMTAILKIPKNKIKASLHLYNDMNIKDEINFWSEKLNLPKEQFTKPYIKKTTRAGLTYKSFGHGTCNLRSSNTTLSEKIAMSIKAISDCYGAKSELFWYN